MRHWIACCVLALACTLFWSLSARAQQEGPYSKPLLAAPSNALELTVGTGYTQGLGMISPRRAVVDVAGPGVSVDAGADYRLNPTWSVGIQGEYQEFRSVQNFGARGFGSNLGVTLHVWPVLREDPWLRVGGGYRLLWDVRPPGTATALRHGFELARAAIGCDIRATSAIALAPEAGVSLDLFLWQSQNGVNSAFASGQAGAFFFAGVQGRFDMGPRSPSSSSPFSTARQARR